LVGQGYQFTEGTTVNKNGEVFYQDIPASKTYKVDTDKNLITLKWMQKEQVALISVLTEKDILLRGTNKF
jgi:hypothetical protein